MPLDNEKSKQRQLELDIISGLKLLDLFVRKKSVEWPQEKVKV